MILFPATAGRQQCRVLKNEIAQLRRLVADLRGELGEVLTRQNDMERSFEERLNRHREDLDWDREECVRDTLPSALNVINASSVGKLVQLVTASRLTLYHEG